MAETATDGAAPRFAGFIDDFASGRLHGWAVDRHGADYGACLAVFAGGRLVGLCRADVDRPDLAALMPGDGRHGFECLLDEAAFAETRFDAVAVTDEVYRRLTGAEASGLDGSGPVTWPVTWPAFEGAFQGQYGPIGDMNEGSPGLRDLRPGADGPPAQDRADGAGTLLLEIGDLVAFHRVHERVTGIQRVLCGLIAALSAAEGADDIAFCLPSRRPGVVNVVDAALLNRLVALLLGEGAIRENLDRALDAVEGTARARRTGPADVLLVAGAFWTHERLDRGLARMREQGTRLGLLVYDLIPLTHPHLVSGETRRAFAAPAMAVLPLFDFVFTISAFVAGQVRSILANEFGREPAVRAVPLPHRAIATGSGGSPGRGAARRVPPLPPAEDPFVLCVCTIEVRKNHMLLYRVWAGLLRKHGRGAVPRLVLVGRWGWDVAAFRRALEASDNLDGHVVVLSDVGDDALADLYARCRFTVFPSFAEGWGLPVGESLAAGKACVASRATAIPEVGGDFCAYFDPSDVLDAFAAIERAIVDPSWVPERERAIAAAFRARSWADTASHLLRGLRDVRAAPRPEGGDRRRGLVYTATDVIDFTGLSREDDAAPWRLRAAESVLAAGWHPLGPQGARAYAREATVALATDMDLGARITVLLRLAGTGRDRPCRLRIEAGREAAVVTVAGRAPRWSEIEGAVDRRGILRVTIAGLSEGAFAPEEADAAFVLLGLAMFGDDPRGRLAAYRAIMSLLAMDPAAATA